MGAGDTDENERMSNDERARRRAVGSALVLLFLMMAAHAAMEAARDAFLLGALSPVALPWSYVLIAVLAVASSRLAGRRARATRLAGILVVGAAAAFVFWGVLPLYARGGAIALYVFSALYVTIIVPRFWLLLAGRFTVGEAKRYYTWIGVGGIAGAAAGSAMATFIASRVHPRALLAAAGAIYVVAAIVARATATDVPGREATQASNGPRSQEPKSYVRRLVWSALLASAALTVVDYLFKSTAAATIPKEQLASYFARTYTAMNVVALVVQITLAPALLRRFGTHTAAMMLPVLLVAATGGFAIVGLPLLVLVARGADGALRNSLHRVTFELFYFPLSDATRARWKALADAVGQRGGQALGSLALLGLVALGAGSRTIAILAAVLALGWAIVTMWMRGPYLSLFRDGLRRGGVPATVPVLASDTLQAILEAFSSPDDLVVCAAIDLLAENGHVRLVPSVLVRHPSRTVVLRALDAFVRGKRSPPADLVAPLLRHPDGKIRAAAFRAGLAANADLARAMRDPDVDVRATAVVGLLRGDPKQRAEAKAYIEELLARDDAKGKLAFARATKADPDPELAPYLVRLLDTRLVTLCREVLRAMAVVPSASYLPALVPLLADRRVLGELRPAILAAAGGDSSAVEGWLADESLPRVVRRHVPRTLSAFASERAATVLLARLDVERDGAVRYKILRGLGRLRADQPSISLDEEAVLRHADRYLDRAVRLLAYRIALGGAGDDPIEELLRPLLQNKEDRALESVFRLLGIVRPKLALEDVWRGVKHSDAHARDAALELVESLPSAIRLRLVGMLRVSDDVSRLEEAGGEQVTRAEAIAAMTNDGSLPLRELALALTGRSHVGG